MRIYISALVIGFLTLGLALAGPPGDPLDPEVLEAKVRKVREQLEKLRAEERALAEQLAQAKESVPGSIKAEVTGVLRYPGKGECYYISVWSSNGETRVYLLPASDKARDQFGTLHGKAVVATGPMHQRHAPKATPLTTQVAEVPEGAFFMWPVEITPAPTPKK